jgi:mRNA interferase YafQ
MNSTRKKESKRTNFPKSADYTKEFKEDWERLTCSGGYNMKSLKEVMLLIIANDGPLPYEWRDHQRDHEWADHRELHVGGDFLLIYKLAGKGSASNVIFVRTGTYSELFD